MAYESILRGDNQLIILFMSAVLVIIGNAPDGVRPSRDSYHWKAKIFRCWSSAWGGLDLSPARVAPAIAALVLIGTSDVFAPAHRRP